MQTTDNLVAVHALAEAGFLASEMGLSAHAISIFAGLAKLQPDTPHAAINLALVYARYERADEAIDLLQSLHPRFPDHPLLQAVLGVCLTQQERPGALALLDAVLAAGSDVDAVNVARSCIDLARQQQAGRERRTPTEGLQFFRHYNPSRADAPASDDATPSWRS